MTLRAQNLKMKAQVMTTSVTNSVVTHAVFYVQFVSIGSIQFVSHYACLLV